MNKKTLSKISIAFLLTSAIIACKETELPTPVTEQPPTEEKGPVAPTPPPPAQQPTPAQPGILRRIKWSPLDYKEFEYNAQGALTKYITQYNNVQGSDNVNRNEYTYTYYADGQLTNVTESNGMRTEYTYINDVWKEAITFDKLNRAVKKYEFQFNDKKQLIAYTTYDINLTGNSTPKSKTTLTYTPAGNLTLYKVAYYNESSSEFKLAIELQFSNFDTKKYPKNADSFDAVLQPLTFFVNNPGKKEFLNSSSPIENYSYVYDVHGYPVSKNTSYTYSKPLPELNAIFEY